MRERKSTSLSLPAHATAFISNTSKIARRVTSEMVPFSSIVGLIESSLGDPLDTHVKQTVGRTSDAQEAASGNVELIIPRLGASWAGNNLGRQHRLEPLIDSPVIC